MCSLLCLFNVVLCYDTPIFKVHIRLYLFGRLYHREAYNLSAVMCLEHNYVLSHVTKILYFSFIQKQNSHFNWNTPLFIFQNYITPVIN